MASITKENEVLTTTSDAASRPSAPTAAPGETTPKPQPVALEVPVTVNGARAVDGSDKREPFSESTKTVLVFGTGAVIRLQSPVAPGQLLFLTNEKTKKEVVCQVVKSKNYRNVSGYVELEFTEQVVGFWGMRFPSDRIGAAPAATAAPPAPQAVKPSVTPVSSGPLPLRTVGPSRPDATANFNALKAMVSSPESLETPQSSNVRITPTVPVTEARVEAKPPAVGPPAAPKPLPAPSRESTTDVEGFASANPETRALKQQTARLQEQLSSMLFTEKPGTSSPAEPPMRTAEVHNSAAQILELAKPETPFVTPLTSPVSNMTEFEPAEDVAQPAKVAPSADTTKARPAVEADEVKIPSWLESLARNAAIAPAVQPPAPLREEARQHEEPLLESHIAAAPLAESAPANAEVPVPSFNAAFLGPAGELSESSTRGSNKGILIGTIAAGLLLTAAGVTWYMRNQSGPTPAVATTAAISSTAAPVPSAPQNQAQTSAQTLTQASTLSTGGPPVTSPVVSTPVQVSKNLPAAPSTNKGTGVVVPSTVSNAVAKSPQPAATQPPAQVQVQPPPKKPLLGEVRLEAPKVHTKGRAISASAEELGITLSGAEPAPSVPLGGLETSTKQPSAPAEALPVGGDVKPAKLVSSVSPNYPALARSQHVAGDVRVDALIDPTGHVTTMKVVSGPTLLHQAAMDALRQWKYQPATLDGKPVAMHLTVTLQFRLQ